MTLITRGTICLIEDDPLIRLNATLLLRQADFHVAEFDCVDTALAALTRDVAGIVMIFTRERTDGVFDGRDLAHLAAQRWPWITVAITAEPGPAGAEQLPGRVVVLGRTSSDEDVLNCARQAELDYRLTRGEEASAPAAASPRAAREEPGQETDADGR